MDGVCACVSDCVRRTTKPLKVFLSFVLLFFTPLEGDTAIKGTKLSRRWIPTQENQLRHECQTCMKSLFSQLTAIQLLSRTGTAQVKCTAGQQTCFLLPIAPLQQPNKDKDVVVYLYLSQIFNVFSPWVKVADFSSSGSIPPAEC